MNKFKRFLVLALSTALVVGGIVGCGKKEEEEVVVEPKVESAEVIISKALDNLKTIRSGYVDASVNHEDETANLKFAFNLDDGFGGKADVNYKDSEGEDVQKTIYLVTEDGNLSAYWNTDDGYCTTVVPLSILGSLASTSTNGAISGGAISGGAISGGAISEDFKSSLDYDKVNVELDNGIYTLSGTVTKDDISNEPDTLDGAKEFIDANASGTSINGGTEDSLFYEVTVDSNDSYKITNIKLNATTDGENVTITIDLSGLGNSVIITVPDSVKSDAKMYDFSNYLGGIGSIAPQGITDCDENDIILKD